ncbi:MAG: sigma-70 family RNA polymerase sigma factor [Bacteroidetes bacterium]|nr:sigma-70 family RNA polymerase sigma factor [Bacteroidota bacterium]
MEENPKSRNELLPHLFRLEYSKMTAVLCRHFGLKHIEIAEDIVSETFLKATEVWEINGIPENPTAWLYTVAKNKTKDYLKRLTIFETKIKDTIKEDEFQFELDFDFAQQTIVDSQLAMIFAVCNPINSDEAQICLALQILCGFSVEEIADAFLTKTETIKKRLFRARTNLRNNNFQIKVLHEATIQSRLDTVLMTLYLLFNEGYSSKSNDHLIRKDLCSESIRLALILTENQLTNTPKTNALLALMCFQSSRLDARVNDSGEAILFEQQDKNLWNKELIEKGNYYLINACSWDEISKYHLEAAIAYWHTTPTDRNKWEHILQIYNQLILIEYSPMTALNRTFALAKVYGNEQAIKEAEKLNMIEINYYHSLLGYLYSDIDTVKAIAHYNKALDLTKSTSEKKTLMKEIERLERMKNGN